MTPNLEVWKKLAAPIPADEIQWRQDGKPVQRDGKYVARFVAYVDAQLVRARLDDVAAGDWSLTLELLPSMTDEDGVAGGMIAFKARLMVFDVCREDVGQGKDYKSASSDAFKRAAVRFGVAHELYAYEQNWVTVDGDGRYAKPLEDPGVVYARRQARAKQRSEGNGAASRTAATSSTLPSGEHTGSPAPQPDPIQATTPVDAALAAVPKPDAGPRALDEPSCPKCGGRLYDNRAENDVRATKGEKLRPDWKCRNRSCNGVIWRPKKTESAVEFESGPVPF